ncbi:MAG TPA: DUF481 domain-containing protein [Bryobacteraceae bacterium]
MKPVSATRAAGPSLRVIIRTAALASILLLAGPLGARESTDVLVMQNGDRLTGTIKRLDAGVLYFGLDYADGDLSIDWTKVARVESKQLFIVKTQNGSVFVGNLTTVAKTNIKQATKLQIAGPAQAENPIAIDMANIVNVRQTSDEFWRRLSGGISFGSTYSKGNNATQYTLGFDTAYQRERWGAQTNFSSNLSSNSGNGGVNTSTRNMLSFGAQQLLPWQNYFYGGLGSLLQSSVQGISLQTSLGAGLGRYLKNTNRSRIALLGGLAWQGTEYQSDVPQPRQNVISALAALDLSLFKFSKTNLNVSATLFPALSDPGRLRFNTNASYYVKVFGDLSWTITFYGNWDTKPPPHFSGSDYGTTSGLSWTFGK